jgi:hypothetical protein
LPGTRRANYESYGPVDEMAWVEGDGPISGRSQLSRKLAIHDVHEVALRDHGREGEAFLGLAGRGGSSTTGDPFNKGFKGRCAPRQSLGDWSPSANSSPDVVPQMTAPNERRASRSFRNDPPALVLTAEMGDHLEGHRHVDLGIHLDVPFQVVDEHR